MLLKKYRVSTVNFTHNAISGTTVLFLESTRAEPFDSLEEAEGFIREKIEARRERTPLAPPIEYTTHTVYVAGKEPSQAW